ncbi:MAG: low molecular weight phosphatase family protein [Microbacteriaceae bacterium]|nr:low molecular weight phosphatase family protein [Microbacteriaceae bacterium]
MNKPVILFMCQHNAGRSQLGAALMELQAGNRYEVRSAGLAPADHVNEAGAESLRELGKEIGDRVPRRVTEADLREADVVVAMKPGLELPVAPSGRLIEWSFPNPENWDLDGIRPLRDAIAAAIAELDHELRDLPLREER